jgi:hypothetical protein
MTSSNICINLQSIFVSKLLQSAIGLIFVSDTSYIVSYHNLILLDVITEGLWLSLHKGGLGGHDKCLLCRSGIMDDREGQIFIRTYIYIKCNSTAVF